MALGLDGIELYEPCFTRRDSAAKGAYSDAAHNAGLAVATYASGCYAHPESSLCSPEWRERGVAYIKKSVDEAAIFKTDVLRVVSGTGTY